MLHCKMFRKKPVPAMMNIISDAAELFARAGDGRRNAAGDEYGGIRPDFCCKIDRNLVL